MQTIRILFSQYSLPSESSFYKINFENFRDLLKDKVKIELICLVYRSRRLTDEEKLSNHKKVIDFRDYSNADEVIKKENPDIIVAGGWSTALISNSLVLAAKFLKIPVVNWLQMPLFDNELAINRKNTFVKLLQSQNPTDNDKQFMMRGRFFLKRYLFFFNTQRAIGTKISKIFELLFSFFKKFFIFNDKVFNPQFSGDLSFLSGEKLLKNLLELGFDNKKLVLTGFPAYDKSFQILSSFQPKTGDKIRVLFAPTTFYEHGDWTKNQRDKILKEIIKNLNDHKEKIVLTVKIHPSYSNLIEYQEIINSINPSIPLYRTKDFLELVANSDVVLDYSGVSTSLVFALIAKKPIVLCNYDHISDDIFLEKGLALKCTNPSLLFQSIMSVLKSNPASDEKREKFIRDYLYSSDGKASERIFDKMISLLPSFEK